MDIGKFINNDMYCEADLCDDEIVLSSKENPELNLNIWEGYFCDIFEHPPLNGLGWRGFTRDYHEFKGAFSSENDSKTEIENPREYLEDLLQYVGKKFRMEESYEVLKLIISFLQYAIETNQTVLVEVV